MENGTTFLYHVFKYSYFRQHFSNTEVTFYHLVVAEFTLMISLKHCAWNALTLSCLFFLLSILSLLVQGVKGAGRSFLTYSAWAVSYIEEMQCYVSSQTAEGNFP